MEDGEDRYPALSICRSDRTFPEILSCSKNFRLHQPCPGRLAGRHDSLPGTLARLLLALVVCSISLLYQVRQEIQGSLPGPRAPLISIVTGRPGSIRDPASTSQLLDDELPGHLLRMHIAPEEVVAWLRGSIKLVCYSFIWPGDTFADEDLLLG